MSNGVIITVIICVTIVAITAIDKISVSMRRNRLKKTLERLYKNKEDK